MLTNILQPPSFSVITQWCPPQNVTLSQAFVTGPAQIQVGSGKGKGNKRKNQF